MKGRFYKYQALGNDYIVIEKKNLWFELDKESIRKVCDRHFGIGSDGILLGSKLKDKLVELRIFNPDGSEAEKSGNGLRIFMSHLYRKSHQGKIMNIETKGGVVEGHVLDDIGNLIRVNMGVPSFSPKHIPLNTNKELIKEPFEILGEKILLTAISIGNPHAVYITKELNSEKFKKIGPIIESHELFKNRINVQAVRIIDNENIEILIWERGAGYTWASGSSSCAAAYVSNYTGLVGKTLGVHMPGGIINIEIKPDKSVWMSGEVQFVYLGKYDIA